MIASAPGKVLWTGEYAVLDGAPAVVMAVERRAIARVTDGPQRLSSFLEAARAELPPAAAEVLARVRVDSNALSQDGRKLGLGSSAAATVAAVAAALGKTGAEVHAVAHRAHARAQAARGARGSGADIAASVHGGLLEVRRVSPDDDVPLAVRRLALPAGLDFALLWTGTPADTPTLVAHVRRLRELDPAAHAACMDDLAAASAELIAATTAAAAVAAIARGAAALAGLARRSGAPLVPPAFQAVADLAAAHGGAAKPTGAGGGDLVLAVFPEEASRFRAAARAAGMILITADVARVGVLLA